MTPEEDAARRSQRRKETDLMSTLKPLATKTAVPPTLIPPWWQGEIVMPDRRADVGEYQLDGEAVLFDRTTHRMHLLNHTALTVWRRCDGRTTARQVVKSLTLRYAVDSESALEHLEQLVARFSRAGLLEHGGQR